jgi:hypothetical protein
LSRKKSNAYQALQNSFQSELFLWLAATCLPVCMSLQRLLTTCFVCLCGAGMCKECDAIGMVLPSLESFRQWWNLPKIYFLFYDYFLKSVIQASVWIDRVNTPSSGMGSRLGLVISKAYALASLESHYFSWLY